MNQITIGEKPLLKALIIEDNEINIKVFSLLLPQCGIKAFNIARNGKEAIEIFSSEKFDVVFLDIGLPDISGIEVCRKLREILKGKRLPIIACTANHQCEQECIEAGVDEFIVKPISITKIRSLMQRWFI